MIYLLQYVSENKWEEKYLNGLKEAQREHKRLFKIHETVIMSMLVGKYSENRNETSESVCVVQEETEKKQRPRKLLPGRKWKK